MSASYSFSQSFEDLRDKDDWRLRVNGVTGYPTFTWKMDIKQCVYMPLMSVMQIGRNR